MREIYPENVQEWITWLKARGVRSRRIQYCKVSILNAIFTTALRDNIIAIHPSRGIKTDLEGYAKALKKSSPVMACSVSSNFSMGGR